MRKEGDRIRHEPEMMPCCGYIVTAAADPEEPDEDKTVMPKPRDLAICLNCGAVLMYADDASTKRLMSAEEVLLLEPDVIRQLNRMIRIIKDRGPLPKMRKAKWN